MDKILKMKIFCVVMQGLLPAMKEVMPYAHHRSCVMHIWKNFIKQWKDKQVRVVV